ncbi:MAG: hypothetical protein V4722_24050 [Bacteroidota bacterium]
MKRRTVDYLNRKKALIDMAHTHDVKSLLLAEFKSTRNIVVKKDILKTIEQIQHMGKPKDVPAKEEAASS